MTPNERHSGQEQIILAHRQQVYERARRRNPKRWSRATRNWSPVGEVVLNPERNESLEEAATPINRSDNYLDTHRCSTVSGLSVLVHFWVQISDLIDRARLGLMVRLGDMGAIVEDGVDREPHRPGAP